jgi:hypothetical protein
MADHSADLGFGKTEIFLQKGLDRQSIYRHARALICPSGKSVERHRFIIRFFREFILAPFGS